MMQADRRTCLGELLKMTWTCVDQIQAVHFPHYCS